MNNLHEDTGVGLTRAGLAEALIAVGKAEPGALDAMFAAPAQVDVARDVNPLRELMAAERMLMNETRPGTVHKSAPKIGSRDVAAARLREKRRQKSKQAARRLKARS